jgi:hypothetical protein
MRIISTQYIIPFFMALAVIFCLNANAAAGVESVPEELAPAFEQLLSLAGAANPKAPAAEALDPIIGFLNHTKDLNQTFSMGDRKGAASNYSEFRINRSLKEVLDLVYNPDIPPYLITPASIRRSQWLRINGRQEELPRLSDFLDHLTEPVMFTGVEFVENTPDTFSGAYYAYELDRALVLLRHKGRKVLLSISRQRDKSDVGKKGLVLGDDENWNYLYTAEKGCTKPGLGWVDSYMYDSAAITVYYEVDGPVPQVHCGVFKWIRAGWAGMNFVQPHHIRSGAQRFAKTFKALIESPALSDIKGFSTALRQISDLPLDALRQKVKHHYLGLKKIHQDSNRLVRRWFDHFSGENGYLAKMSPAEMKAVLEKAYLKKVLGKNPLAEAGKKTAECQSLVSPGSTTRENTDLRILQQHRS